MKSVALLAVELLALVLSGCTVVSGRPEAPLRKDQMARQIEITQKKIICGLNNRKVDDALLSLGQPPAEAKSGSSTSPDYYCASSEMSPDDNSYRNDVILNAILLIDINYQGFINEAGLEQRKKDIGVDVTTLSLNLAGAAVGATQAKTVLAAVSAGVLGTNTSFDKTFVYEQTIPTLLAQMNADRSEIYSRIVEKMRTLGLKDYSMQEAIHDLIDYYNSGTLQGAIISIRKNAGGRQAKAEAAVQTTLSNPLGYELAGADDVAVKKRLNNRLAMIKKSPDLKAFKIRELAIKIENKFKNYGNQKCEMLSSAGSDGDIIDKIRDCLKVIGQEGEHPVPIAGLMVIKEILSDAKLYDEETP